MDEVTVSIAAEPEARACLALLPEVKSLPVELLIARRRGVLAGAAALHWQSWTTPAGFPTQIHVIPDERGQGVGRRLLAAAADLAGEETDGLWSFTAARDESDAARFMRACGWRPARRQHHFEAAIEALLDDVGPKADRLRARGRVPEGLRIAPLAEAPLEEIGWMVSTALGGGPHSALHGLRQRLDRPDDRSQVVLRGDQLVAVVLWRIESGVAVIDARVVHAQFRGGWSNALLLEAGLLRGKAEGLTRLRFHCDDTVRDTLSLARRGAATETETNATWYYAIAAN